MQLIFFRRYAVILILTALTASVVVGPFGSAIASEPQRIVTLAPSLAELAAELIPDHLDRIVGVSEFTDYPPALAPERGKTTSIGPYFKFSLEKVIALKPDLVIATREGNDREQVLKLKERGIPTVVISTETLTQVLAAILEVGGALGGQARERAALTVGQIQRGVEHFKKRASERKSVPRVLIQVDQEPLVVAGKKAFLTDALSVVGALNVFADLEGQYPRPSLEEVLRRDPDSILILSFAHNKAPVSRWAEFAKLKAVRSHRVRELAADALLRPGIRMLEGLAILERTLFGDSLPRGGQH